MIRSPGSFNNLNTQITNINNDIYDYSQDILVYDDIQYTFTKVGLYAFVRLFELKAKARSYMQYIAPPGFIPELYRPQDTQVFEIKAGPLTHRFRLKIIPDGSIMCIYRDNTTIVDGATINLIYNNQIDVCYLYPLKNYFIKKKTSAN